MGQFTIRPATAADAKAMAVLYAMVAEERDGIAAEPPVDIAERSTRFARETDGTVVAVADGQLVGLIHVDARPYGVGEIGMLVDRGWRGRGVGSALLQAAIGWARERGLHKMSLEAWPHNTRAIALYRKFGFVQEGRRVRHYRRASGELWDAVIMGLPL